jgi:hypothetical protein
MNPQSVPLCRDLEIVGVTIMLHDFETQHCRPAIFLYGGAGRGISTLAA